MGDSNWNRKPSFLFQRHLFCVKHNSMIFLLLLSSFSPNIQLVFALKTKIMIILLENLSVLHLLKSPRRTLNFPLYNKLIVCISVVWLFCQCLIVCLSAGSQIILSQNSSPSLTITIIMIMITITIMQAVCQIIRELISIPHTFLSKMWWHLIPNFGWDYKITEYRRKKLLFY